MFLKAPRKFMPTLKKADCKNTKVFISTQNKNVNILKKIKLVKDRRCYFFSAGKCNLFFHSCKPQQSLFL